MCTGCVFTVCAGVKFQLFECCYWWRQRQWALRDFEPSMWTIVCFYCFTLEKENERIQLDKGKKDPLLKLWDFLCRMELRRIMVSEDNLRRIGELRRRCNLGQQLRYPRSCQRSTLPMMWTLCTFTKKKRYTHAINLYSFNICAHYTDECTHMRKSAL